jgi:RNA polymerase sigma-70 factor, ECF subfamily
VTTTAAADAESPSRWGYRRLGAVEQRASSQRLNPATPGDHVDRLYRAARAMCVSREEAEDLVHEALARASRRPHRLHDQDDVGHLLRVLKRAFLSAPRSAARRAGTAAAPDEPHAALYRAIASLPDALRDVVIAVDVAGLSYKEASRTLRVREKTVATRLHCARHGVAHVLADA